MNDLYTIQKAVDDFSNAGPVFGLLIFCVWALVLVAPYFINGYALMCTGRKAKVSGDFMPFIPIACQIYQMKIARCPIWYIFFFGITPVTVGLGGLVSFLVFKLTERWAIVSVLIFIYVVACMVFTFLYYQKFYEGFGFNPNAAWLKIIPPFWGVALVFGMLIAFSNSIRHGKYQPQAENGGARRNDTSVPQNKGIVVGVAGAYTDAKFDLVDGAELIFGRSPQDANIVFDQTATDVSRKHCSVRYDGRARQYVVTDYSTTGTYLENGTRLESGQPKQVACGTVIYLGSTRKNGFRLN